jgi:hypothetical protein
MNDAPSPHLVATPELVEFDVASSGRELVPRAECRRAVEADGLFNCEVTRSCFRTARVEARDRRLSAIHEAAHVVIARHVGMPAAAWIYRWPTDDPMREKTWGGKTILGGKPSRPQRAMISVAGAVAEYVWDSELDFLRDEGELVWWEPEIMSDTDWRLAGCAPGEPNAKFMGAVDKVIDLLAGPLRADLYAEARRLIVDFGRAAA